MNIPDFTPGSQAPVLLYGGAREELSASIASAAYVMELVNQSPVLPSIEAVCFLHEDLGVTMRQGGERLITDEDPAKTDLLTAVRRWMRGDVYLLNCVIGRWGEDGRLPSLAELFGIPGNFDEVGPASMAMDKFAMGAFVNGMSVAARAPRTHLVRDIRKDLSTDLEARILDREIIVKPNASGSSDLVRRIVPKSLADVAEATWAIVQTGRHALVQERIIGREMTVGISFDGHDITALPVCEITTPDQFFGYSEKYASLDTRETFLGPDDPLAHALQEVSLAIFETVGFRFHARFDFIVNDDGIFFLEANTIPGMTASSILPKMIEEAGLPPVFLANCWFRSTTPANISSEGKIHV